MLIQRDLGGESVRLSPLAAMAAREGAARESVTSSAYVERLVLDAIPEAE